MANQGEFSASETAENIVSTPPAVSNTGTMLPLRFVGRRNRSEAWNHFTIDPGLEKKAKCNYCGGLIKFEIGTSAMRNHTSRCKNNLDREMSKRQKSIASSATEVASSAVVSKFDQQVCRDEMVKMFIDMEIPFRQVEHPSFRRFLSVVQPKLDVVSRTKFKACFEQEHTEYRGWVCLDVETQWNSTYLMCDAALKHKRTFEELSLVNTKFGNELAPIAEDWDRVRALLPFLKLFYESTLRISSSNYVISSMYMVVVLGIGKKIRQMLIIGMGV